MKTIIGLKKYKNEYFIFQDHQGHLGIVKTETGDYVLKQVGGAFPLNTITRSTIIELIDPFETMFEGEEQKYDSSEISEDSVLIVSSIPIRGGGCVALWEVNPEKPEWKLLFAHNRKEPKVNNAFSLL